METIKETEKRTAKKRTKAVAKKRKMPTLPTILVVLAAAFMMIKGAMLQTQIIKNQDTIAQMESQKQYEQKRGEEIDNIKQNVNTDEYIEKIAREKLGMIRKDEILFIDVNGEK